MFDIGMGIQYVRDLEDDKTKDRYYIYDNTLNHVLLYCPHGTQRNIQPLFFQTQESVDLARKADKAHDTLISPTLVNTTFSGTIAGDAFTDAVTTIAESVAVASDVAPLQRFVSPVPTDVTAWIDYSLDDDVGYDFSGRNRHATNSHGVQKTYDPDRINCGNYTPNVTYIPAEPALTHRHLDLNSHVAAVCTPEFSFATWFYHSNTTQGTLLHIGKTLNGSGGAKFIINVTGTTLMVSYRRYPGSTVIVYEFTTTITNGAWHHLCVTLGAAGNRVYLNGSVLGGTYNSGSNAAYYNFVTAGVNHCYIGAESVSYDDVPSSLDRLRYPWNGYMSDTIFYNRIITAGEVAQIYADNYGFDCICLFGQSNMVGQGATTEPEDEDYTLIQGKVFQWSYKTNCNTADPPVVSSNTIEAAVNVLGFPIQTFSNKTGVWKTYCEEYLKNTTMAYRRKLCVIPGAVGATSFANGEWRPSGLTYRRALAGAQYCMANNFMSNIISFHWFQGEGDMGGDNLQYVSDWETMIAALQSNIVRFPSTTPCIIYDVSQCRYDTEVGPGGEDMKAVIRAAFNTLVAAQPTTRALVQTSDLVVSGDGIHWAAPAMRIAGRRGYDKHATLVSNSNRDVVAWKDAEYNSQQPTLCAYNFNTSGNLNSLGVFNKRRENIDKSNLFGCVKISAARTFTPADIPRLLVLSGTGYQCIIPHPFDVPDGFLCTICNNAASGSVDVSVGSAGLVRYSSQPWPITGGTLNDQNIITLSCAQTVTLISDKDTTSANSRWYVV